MPIMYDVPVADTAEYNMLRAMQPTDVIPMPGEPVMGHVAGMLIVRASNGTEVGYYDYWSDHFTPDSDWPY